MDKDRVIDLLNRLLECELAGVVRYTHYSFLVFGAARPGDGGVGPRAAKAEAQALALYRELVQAVEGRSVALEEYARQMIQVEEMHAAEVDKMLEKAGRRSGVLARP